VLGDAIGAAVRQSLSVTGRIVIEAQLASVLIANPLEEALSRFKPLKGHAKDRYARCDISYRNLHELYIRSAIRCGQSEGLSQNSTKRKPGRSESSIQMLGYSSSSEQPWSKDSCRCRSVKIS
jgi:hypothetical protein